MTALDRLQGHRPFVGFASRNNVQNVEIGPAAFRFSHYASAFFG